MRIRHLISSTIPFRPVGNALYCCSHGNASTTNEIIVSSEARFLFRCSSTKNDARPQNLSHMKRPTTREDGFSFIKFHSQSLHSPSQCSIAVPPPPAPPSRVCHSHGRVVDSTADRGTENIPTLQIPQVPRQPWLHPRDGYCYLGVLLHFGTR